ncbi:diacylglycerol kinase [Desulfoluna spongiiphila]|uniref:diacylglycerol kinase n=1 Tax=Desulfoluna spongiiphila TaxID=419481 RepID=UPI00125A1D8F|nr:diacylglycerol kinase [Desulfoluna spongiiphila]VVS90986.1 diacylglycerol kinase (dagk) superfamily [Desulfoluna spongiiphila]
MKNKMLGTGDDGYNPLRKFKVIMQGLRYSASDFSVLHKFMVSVVILIPVVIYNGALDASIIVLATVFMLSAEMFNTSIEAICDFIHPEYHDKIGIIKDIAAAATGLAIFAWLLVLVVEIVEVVGHM